MLEPVLDGLRGVESLDVPVNHPEIPAQRQADPVVVAEVVQPAFRFLVDFPPLVRVQLHLLQLKPVVDFGGFPVGVVARAALEENAAVDGIRVKDGHPVGLAGNLPIALLPFGAGSAVLGIAGRAGQRLNVAGDAQMVLQILLDDAALLRVGADLPHRVLHLKPVGVAGLGHQRFGAGDVLLAAGRILGAHPGPAFALLQAVGQAHQRAVAPPGAVQRPRIVILPVHGQVDGLPHPVVGERFPFHIEHQALRGAAEYIVRHILAFGGLLQLVVLGSVQVVGRRIGHINRPAFHLRDESGRRGDDEMLNPVKVGHPVLEVVRVLVHIVEVARLVLLQDERPGTGIVLQDVLGQVEVNALFQQMLGQDFGVVNGQEVDERPGGKRQVELHGILVNLPDDLIGVSRRAVGLFLQLHHLNGDGVGAPEAGTPAPVAGVAVPLHTVHHIGGGQGRPVIPLDAVPQMESVLRPILVDFPAFGQIALHHRGILGAELDNLVVQLRIGNDAGQG